MNRIIDKKYISGVVLFFSIFLAIAGCSGNGNIRKFTPPLPYPDYATARYLQAQVDSSEFLWYTDIKAAASSFMNEYGYTTDGVSTTDIRILGEGLFHGMVEVELPDEIITLTMERAFKYKGKNSIWQVIKIEEQPWPKKESK